MLDAIANRRSIRFFRSDPISDGQVAEVVEAGFSAPSAHAGSPWHVIVVRDQATKSTLAAIHKWARFIERAPVALVVCVDRAISDHFWVEDGSAFLENMLIQATSMGLGSCWIGIRGLDIDGQSAEQLVRDCCGIPDRLGVLAITPLGHAARNPGPHDEQIPEGRVHYDAFGGAPEEGSR